MSEQDKVLIRKLIEDNPNFTIEQLHRLCEGYGCKMEINIYSNKDLELYQTEEG